MINDKRKERYRGGPHPSPPYPGPPTTPPVDRQERREGLEDHHDRSLIKRVLTPERTLRTESQDFDPSRARFDPLNQWYRRLLDSPYPHPVIFPVVPQSRS